MCKEASHLIKWASDQGEFKPFPLHKRTEVGAMIYPLWLRGLQTVHFCSRRTGTCHSGKGPLWTMGSQTYPSDDGGFKTHTRSILTKMALEHPCLCKVARQMLLSPQTWPSAFMVVIRNEMFPSFIHRPKQLNILLETSQGQALILLFPGRKIPWNLWVSGTGNCRKPMC